MNRLAFSATTYRNGPRQDRLPGQEFILVAGDLNAGSDSRAMRHFRDVDLVDTVPGDIDHVFVPRDLLSTNYR